MRVVVVLQAHRARHCAPPNTDGRRAGAHRRGICVARCDGGGGAAAGTAVVVACAAAVAVAAAAGMVAAVV